MCKHGVWIWENHCPRYHEYADFSEDFSVKKANEKVLLRISADSNYAAYVNGERVVFGQ